MRTTPRSLLLVDVCQGGDERPVALSAGGRVSQHQHQHPVVMDEYESILLVKPEVFVFKIPPKQTNRGHRASDWNLQEPQWTGRMKLVAKGTECAIKLEDKSTGQLYAKCPVSAYPGTAIEAVNDSSRYFVIRIQDDNGRTAFIGLGFGDRSDSFDLNVALQDHFKWLKKEKEAEDAPPRLEQDYSFKEGETIKINMRITKKDGSDGPSKSRIRPGGSGGGLLPPPPGAPKIPPPSPQRGSLSATPTDPPRASGWGESDSAGSESARKPPASTVNSDWVQF